MKFAGGNHYHKPIKRLRFGRNWNMYKGAEYSNRHQSVLPQYQTGADPLGNEFKNFTVQNNICDRGHNFTLFKKASYDRARSSLSSFAVIYI